MEVEQGTTGVLSSYGKITGTLSPGRHYLWWPWQKVEFVVDTATEIPYLAPVAVCPTQENVPLKAIEFFLKFRIQEPIAFVRTIGASNFDLVLSSAVQDAIRQRSRRVRTERAYDLRGGDVGDMQDYLNRQLERYGVSILGANIPDVQLPDQYQQHLATRERVAKELAAYEREWELTRKRRIDRLLMEIERSKKERDARLIEVKEARNKARQDVARMLEEKETEAQRVRLEIETRGRATLTEARERGDRPPPPRPVPPRQPGHGPVRAGPPPGRSRRKAPPAGPPPAPRPWRRRRVLHPLDAAARSDATATRNSRRTFGWPDDGKGA